MTSSKIVQYLQPFRFTHRLPIDGGISFLKILQILHPSFVGIPLSRFHVSRPCTLSASSASWVNAWSFIAPCTLCIQSNRVCCYLQVPQLRSLRHRKLVSQSDFRIHEATPQDVSHCCFMTRPCWLVLMMHRHFRKIHHFKATYHKRVLKHTIMIRSTHLR